MSRIAHSTSCLLVIIIGLGMTTKATGQMRGGIGSHHLLPAGFFNHGVGAGLMPHQTVAHALFGPVTHGHMPSSIFGGTHVTNVQSPATMTPAATTMNRPATSGQAFAQLANQNRIAQQQGFAEGMADQRRMDRLRSFYSESPYGAGGYPYLSGGGYGTDLSTYGTKYGAAIQPASSGLLADSIARQQAYFQGSFMNQDYEMRRLQLQRARFDERQYEKANTPAPETVREEIRIQKLTRARNSPPAEEIASGESLNELLGNIERIQTRDAIKGPVLPIDSSMVKHINVTSTGDSRGSNELFKPGALAQWPAALKSESFDADRKALATLISDMAEANANGTLDAVRFDEARKIIAGMRERVFASRFRLPYNDSADASNFLVKIEDAVNLLGRQNALGFLDGRFAATGDTVDKLVDHMHSNGLQFARAKQGDEPYYSNLYKQLATYEIALNRKAEQQTALQAK